MEAAAAFAAAAAATAVAVEVDSLAEFGEGEDSAVREDSGTTDGGPDRGGAESESSAERLRKLEGRGGESGVGLDRRE